MLKEKTDKSLIKYDYPSACAFYLGAIIVTLVCQALVAFIAAGLSNKYPDISQDGNFNGAFMIVIQLANAAFIYFYGKFRKRKLNYTYLRSSEDNKPPRIVDYILPPVCALVLLIGMYLPTLWFGYLTAAMGVPEDAGSIQMDTASALVMVIFASVVLAPICEESIYRGVLLHGLNDRLSTVKAVLLSALAFMLMHMNPLQVVFQFAMGVLCGYIAIRSKRLLPAILTHSLGNVLALIVSATPLGNTLVGCEAWLVRNVAAAFFITLGLFVGGGAALFALVQFGLGNGFKPIQKAIATAESVEPETVKPDITADRNSTADDDKLAADKAKTATEEIRRRDGRFKYFIGLGICIIMLVINLVSFILMK